MEELTLTTPSVLFSAISLIMLAYTNRFLAYAAVIRNLRSEHEQNPTPMTQRQIAALYDPVDADFWGKQFVALCSLYFVYLHWMAGNGGVCFWGSFAFIGDFVEYFHPGNPDFSEGFGILYR